MDLRRGLPLGPRPAAGTSCDPTRSTSSGFDLDGNEISIEADEFLGRVFQHEVDHLDGVLLVERLDEDQRKEAQRSCAAAPSVCSTPTPTGCANLLRPTPSGVCPADPGLSADSAAAGGPPGRIWGTPDAGGAAARGAGRAGHDVALW